MTTNEKINGSMPAEGKGKKSAGGLHIAARLVCLLIAVIIWLYVMEVEKPYYSSSYSGVEVAVNLSEEQSASYLIASVSGETTLRVKVKGNKEALAKYTSEDISAYADLSSVTGAGTYECDVVFGLPDGITLRDDNSYTVTVVIEAVE